MRFLLLLLLLPLCAYGQVDSMKVQARYGGKGFEFYTLNKDYLMQIEWRLQTRIAYPYESDPITFEDFDADNMFIGINRARMKVGGHAVSNKFEYYLEYELFASRLLDFRAMYHAKPWLNIKVGQWKVQYNRERIISSGKQQTVDRSILTYAFTLDRQQGISLYGRAEGRGLLDFSYVASVFMGTGRGASANDDVHLMWMGRLQWNLAGDPVAFRGSDLPSHDTFSMILAVAATTNRSQYTRFSTSGGGQLPGFEEETSGQYRVNQAMQESAGMIKGFSWQQEFHWKQINDLVNNQQTTLIGNLAQIGYFPHYAISAIPRQFELFARYAIYDPNVDLANNFRSEFTTGINFFINKHRNKLSAEYGLLHFQDNPDAIRDGDRVRLQWDVSF